MARFVHATRRNAPGRDANLRNARADPTSVDLDANSIAASAALVDAGRRRVRRAESLHRRSTLLMGSGLLLVVGGWLAMSPRPVDATTFTACVVAFAVAGSIEFEIGPGCALPTVPVQVVALFLLPPQFVPLAVLLGLVGSSLVTRLRDRERKEHLLVLAGSAWHSVGPAAVFAIAHVSGPRISDWPVYALAISAQFALDAAASWIHTCCGLGVSIKKLAAALRFTFLCDLCLAPIGFTASLARPGSPAALAFLAPPTLLFAVLQSDRRRHMDETIALGAAFTNTSDLARRDPMTGLANRLAWEETMNRIQTEDTPIGVVLADVDGLKAANDTFSHDTGDRLLIAVGEILARSLPDGVDATAFRVGGDEFAILVPGASPTATEDLAESVREMFRAAVPIDGVIPVSASIGSARAPAGRNIERAIAAADRAVSLEKISRGVHRRS